MGAASSTPLLDAAQLSKSFGPVRACADVSLRIGEGEIVALLGENGAGKSTFVKMLFGALQPDAGTISWRGRTVSLREPADARRLGITMVHQHFSLFDALTVAENLALVLRHTGLRTLSERARTIAQHYGLSLDPAALVADLSAGERQRVEIVRCLMQEPKLLIMDEPTSVLTPQEAERLFRTLRALKEEGCSVLYISHKLEEVRALCDRAVILRGGRVSAEVDPAKESAQSLAAAMTGTEVSPVSAGEAEQGEVILAASGITRRGETDLSVSLKVERLEARAGEIVGIAGIAGNGQSELFALLSGEARVQDGALSFLGSDATMEGIAARRRRGAAFVPEERLGHAAAPHLPLPDNVLLSRHTAADGTVSGVGLLHPGAARRVAQRIIGAMDVRAPAPTARAAALSGGNLQKFVVGRELDREPRLLVVNQPTWGVDAGAAARIREGLVARAADGAAVIVISQDLDELFALSHRLAVLFEGRLSEARPTRELTRESVGMMMAGAAPQEGPAAATPRATTQDRGPDTDRSESADAA